MIYKEFALKEIDKDIATDFIRKYHYSKILPRITKYYLGIFEGGQMAGVVTLGFGTQPLHTIRKIFYLDDLVSDDYLEIGKMCFSPTMNKTQSFGSIVLKMIVSWVKQNTKCLFLYTLADGIMGKCGYVYQASNFVYLGQFKTSVYYDTQTGEKIHPRSAKKLCEENARFENKKKVFWLTHKFCEYKKIDKINGLMFRYIYPLNKDAKKILKKYDEYKNNKYPKDKDLKFEKRIANGQFIEIEQPKFNMDYFKYNYQMAEDKIDGQQEFNLNPNRKCECCDKDIVEGYDIDDKEFFCSDECLHSTYSEIEYDELCQQNRASWKQFGATLF